MGGSTVERLLRMVAARQGLRLERAGLPPDMDGEFRGFYDECRPFTMTSAERLYALSEAVTFVVRSGVPGDLVECGVWRGGSALLMARVLQSLGVNDRALWLYDTFSGMAEPTEEDGRDARARWELEERGSYNAWCFSGLEDVRAVMARAGYPSVRWVQGKVEDTIPGDAPNQIALVRLDTDWYESTRHELIHLWPRLSAGGVLIIDDYGHWEGARRAVDEFFASTPVLLNRIDYTGRLVQKG